MFLIREIFTRDATKWWFRAIVGAATVQAAFGALLLSIECSPARTLDAKNNDQCSGNVRSAFPLSMSDEDTDVALWRMNYAAPSWMSLTSLSGGPLDRLYSDRSPFRMSDGHSCRDDRDEAADQHAEEDIRNHRLCVQISVCFQASSFPTMIKCTNSCRVWVPMWIHLAFYLRFLRSGRNNIDIVPAMITEELWVALALVSASTPVLMRVAKKFTTSGVILSTSKGYGSRESSSNQRRTGFRPDDVTNSSHCDTHMMRNLNEGASIESRAESQVGILRQVDFQISSESKETT